VIAGALARRQRAGHGVDAVSRTTRPARTLSSRVGAAEPGSTPMMRISGSGLWPPGDAGDQPAAADRTTRVSSSGSSRAARADGALPAITSGSGEG